MLAVSIAIIPSFANLCFAKPNPIVGTIPGTFDVSLSGSANYSIPIKIAPGTAGTQPQIQLNYDSQILGGPLGAGWAVGGLSAITRGPHDQFVDGNPGAVNLDDDDALYLDGQRIIPVSKPAVIGGVRETKYRKVNDDFTEIVQFDPRLDPKLSPDLNHSYFRARTKGGVTLLFGNPEIVTAAPNPNSLDATVRFANGTVMAFAESAAVDTAGNFIAFHYDIKDSDSKDNGEYNISEIDYTGHGRLDYRGVLAVDRNPFAKVDFAYKATRPIDVYVGGQLLRRDKTANRYTFALASPASLSL
jgi:Salmonella virulence plasmid 65kDa B protein